MVQLKYYGDDRDYFKYDLISVVLRESGFRSYGFVPMLTKHRVDNEGDVQPSPSECKSEELLDFIRTHPSPDLNNWESWIRKYVPNYVTIQPINSTHICNQNRREYWSKFNHIIRAPKSLIFFDPDTGVQAGRKTKIAHNEHEKYILNDEMSKILSKLSDSSAFVIYQHLQRNSKLHGADIKRKINAISSMEPSIKVSVYKEKDLAFLFLAKDNQVYRRLVVALNKYNRGSSIKQRGLY
ncbi:MAG: hypothetical protein QGH51_09355 [Planctomycetota bacterium]|jgi:hypothetical protein|nr:hypothetical protein [Planctomycetota bacterium]